MTPWGVPYADLNRYASFGQRRFSLSETCHAQSTPAVEADGLEGFTAPILIPPRRPVYLGTCTLGVACTQVHADEAKPGGVV